MPDFREYRASVRLADPEELAAYARSFMVPTNEIPSITVQLEGISVFHGIAGTPEFTGRKTPKLDPEVVNVTWRSAGEPRSHGDAGLSSPDLYDPLDTLRYYSGIVAVPPIRIRGKNHGAFNKQFADGAEVEVPYFWLKPDRTLSRGKDRVRHLVGGFTLAQITLP